MNTQKLFLSQPFPFIDSNTIFPFNHDKNLEATLHFSAHTLVSNSLASSASLYVQMYLGFDDFFLPQHYPPDPKQYHFQMVS